MLAHILAIARTTLLEAARSRLTLLLTLGLALALGAGQFGASLALTETEGFRAVLYAALARLLCVVALGLFVVSSVLREFDDKLVELTLALPVRRVSLLLGKLLGYAVIAAVAAAVAGALVALTAPPQSALVWSVSLACELMIVAAAGLLLALTLRQVTGALVVLLAGYALSRSIDAIVLLSENPLVDDGGAADALASTVVGAIAMLFPALSRFTQGHWLVDPALPLTTLGPVLGQTLVYVGLLSTVCAFDLSRRQL